MAFPMEKEVSEESGKPKIAIFDMDGTITEPDEGANQAFITAHATGLAELAGRDPGWMVGEYTRAMVGMAPNPDAFGWEIDGVIVAPALVDAFVAAQVSAQVVLKNMGEDIDAWRERLDGLYQAHYLKYTTHFRPGVTEVFTALRDRGIHVYVVTNSDPEKVRKRFEVLGEAAEWIKPRIHGFAKKFVVTPGPNWVPQHTHFPGLKRKIHLRKQHYHDVLGEIMRSHGLGWEDMVVVGDIAELDLVMPVTMGAQGHLIRGQNTPPYEIEWAAQHPRVSVIEDLGEVLNVFE